MAEVDAAQRRVVLDGVDQARRVEVEADYLARTNPYSDAPALEHAYAVTTYSAQGTTDDTAFVMVDPSMDKQELYVAASRSRDETFLYATPEIQSHREEIAPMPDRSADALPHIAAAAERDRAQLAAHDAALRSQFSGLPPRSWLGGARSCVRPPVEKPAPSGSYVICGSGLSGPSARSSATTGSGRGRRS
ncbi:MAG TPA: hypothetical protein VKC63_03045 [Solirubrobacterales bacterium]|nr:hypothetical protein [Solirubrobacterales bacterium]